jgi:hypothetical protein
MKSILWTPLVHGLMITTFVAIMMIAAEYVSILTQGAFQRALGRSRWSMYGAAVLLGAAATSSSPPWCGRTVGW